MATRRILVVQAATSTLDLRSALEAAGWEVQVVPSVASAMAACAAGGCYLGLAVLDCDDFSHPHDLQALAAINGMEWVAVASPQVMQRPLLCKVLVEQFHDFHSLPLDFNRLLVVLGHAFGKMALGRTLIHEPPRLGQFGMVGRSPRMLELYRALDKVIRADAPVLVSGESGTGKEVAARAIHRLSARANGPFVPVNCGALPVNLVQSELFGHERGSFTGAHQRKIGSIEVAAGGVLFLDEIGDLPLDLQASLLRFLQEKTIVRVGATRPIPIDVRIIAASHVDLGESVRRGRFREDLYYRLNVLHLAMPALRERPGDVTLLAEAVFKDFHMQKGPQVKGFSSAALEAMEAHSWPGNVRELINRVQKAMIMCETRLIMPRDLGLQPQLRAAGPISLQNARDLIERDVIRQTLQRNRNNVAATARQLGVSRVTLYRLMHKFDIDVRAATGHELARDSWQSPS